MTSLNATELVTVSVTVDRSKADHAFDLPEIRQQIIDLSERKDQTALMGLDRRWIFQAAEKLFSCMMYKKCRRYLKSDIPLYSLIATAISEIDGQDLDDAATREDLGLDPERTLKEFCPEIFVDFIPTLRDRCPNLRKISLGAYYSGVDGTTRGHSWAITFHGTRPQRREPGYVDTGHILIQYPLPATLMEPPPSNITFTLPPSVDYTIETRFDLFPQPMEEDPYQREWLDVIRREDFCSHLTGTLLLGDLRVTMEDLTNVFRWQNPSGHQRLVDHIDTINCSPYTMHDFASFASLAGVSLRILRLSGPYDDVEPINTDMDLPTLSAVVRQSLPNLIQLDLDLAGIDKVEAACQSALSNDCLDTSGKLRFLRLHVASKPGRLPNAVRCVYGICAEEASLSFSWRNSDWDVESADVHQHLLKFLQAQPLATRRALATLDLTSLSALV